MLKSTHKPKQSSSDLTPLPPGWTEHTAPTGHAYYSNTTTKQSTYTRPTAPTQPHLQGASSPHVIPPLLSGWTEHKAPTGHAYYYNATTKQSTYTRPIASPKPYSQETSINPVHSNSAPPQGFNPPGFPIYPSDTGSHPNASLRGFQGNLPGSQFPYRGERLRGNLHHRRKDRNLPEDRPKSKQAIPGCEPWLLVNTKLGRRFYYHPEKGASFWKIPEELREGIERFNKAELQRIHRHRGEGEGDGQQGQNEKLKPEVSEEYIEPPKRTFSALDEYSEEYEEVDESDEEDGGNSAKRQKTWSPDQPVEFNEDDIAWQLAAMGGDGNEGHSEFAEADSFGELGEGAENHSLTENDSKELFKDLLDDYLISPYSTWEKVIEEGKVVEDERYKILPNMKSRREVWDEWSREGIRKLREEKAKVEKKDPRIPYLEFLQKHATLKLYWPEFKRKYKKEPEMRDSKLSDKDREKWYRDYISRLKLPLSTLTHDLNTLLKTIPLSSLNRSTTISILPLALLVDIRYISVPPASRDPLIKAYISTLPAPPPVSEAIEDAEDIKKREERGRRERALREREKMVLREKMRVKGDIEMGKGRLRGEEAQLEQAMKVGKGGLLGQLQASGIIDGPKNENDGTTAE